MLPADHPDPPRRPRADSARRLRTVALSRSASGSRPAPADSSLVAERPSGGLDPRTTAPDDDCDPAQPSALVVGHAHAGRVPTAVRAAADEYARAHPDPDGEEDDDPAPGGVRRVREGPRIRWAVSWRVAGAATLAVALVAGAVVLRSVALTPGAAVDLPEPAPLGTVATAASAPSASPTPQVVIVDVVGAVAAPGVRRLPAGSRVADAVSAAGGATGDADLARVNLARVLVDGEQIVVPRPGDALPAATEAPPAAGAGTDLVNLNTASLAELDELPGVGPVLAQRIVDRRPFASVDELDEVSGIGPTLLGRLRPLVRV